MVCKNLMEQQDLAERVKFAAKATHELVELAKSRGQEPRVSTLAIRRM